MTSQLTFGWYLDGPCFPETADGSEATLDKLIAGPAGLINQLALRHGLVRPLNQQAVRIANYLSALQQIDDGYQIFSRSFQIDAWSTASYLLVFRDQLVTAGWKPDIQQYGSPKLKALCQAEIVAQNVAGVADLTRDVMTRVQASRKNCGISSIQLVSQSECLSKPWVNLFHSMAKYGTQINQHEATPVASPKSDLGQIQRMFSGATTCNLSNDGTVTILEADDELQASESVAAFLAANPIANENLVIIRGANTSLLDESCSAQGLPRIGGEQKSRWRSIPQLLPLAISCRWEPADPLAILEFLSLPLSPVPKTVGYRFAKALRSKPGFGSAQWNDAWQQATDGHLLESQATENAISGTTQRAFERELSYWLLPARFDPQAGIPTHELIAVSRRIQKWAVRREHGGDSATSEMLMELYALCKCFEDAVKATGLSKVTKAQTKRILDAVFKDGVSAPGSSAEASAWSHVDVPGQIFGAASSVVWWGCVANRSERFHFPWTTSELEALQSQGVTLEHPAAETLREADSWRTCLFNVKDALLMVRPRMSAGEPTRQHPFCTELSARLNSVDSKKHLMVRRAHELYEHPTIALANRELLRQQTEQATIPKPTKMWEISPSLLKPRAEESASSIELLLGCPFAWTLRYHAQLHPGSMLSLPQAGELTGDLIHSCIHQLYTENKIRTAESASKRVMEIFDKQVREIALPLLMPGRGVERSQIRKALGEAIFEFQNLIREREFDISETEVRRRSKFLNGDLVGQLDLVLKDKNFNEYIVDFKWSKTVKYKMDEIKKGQHLQLACYASLQRGLTPSTIEAGYYMVKQRQLLSAEAIFFPADYVKNTVSLESLWQSVIDGCAETLTELSSGLIRAAGVDYPSSDVANVSARLMTPPCKFCDYGYICGNKEYAQ